VLTERNQQAIVRKGFVVLSTHPSRPQMAVFEFTRHRRTFEALVSLQVESNTNSKSFRSTL
jgi:hypothetical protein